MLAQIFVRESTSRFVPGSARSSQLELQLRSLLDTQPLSILVPA
jgi:hypothetical protein